MSSNTITILFIADVFGQPGIDILQTFLPTLKKKHNADFVILNGENAHEGRGINEAIVKNFYHLGVDVITGGNHSFDKWKIFEYMKSDKNLLRPMNYPRGAHGYGFGIYEIAEKGVKVGVINLMGRTFMPPLDDPFRTADWVIDKIKEETSIIFVDFHAEATAEKIGLGFYLDGRVSCLVGTHTHIPTNDARILEKGTAYITDVGMTGSFNSVIGLDKETAVKRFLLGTPHRFKVGEGDARICAVKVEIDTTTGLAQKIVPIIFPEFNQSMDS